MALEREIVKETPYPTRMSWELAERWADGIPLFGENDPSNPEWKPTPVVAIDLSEYGYGPIYVKDESVNPTRTFKDRAAWEIATLYRDFARALHLQKKAGAVNGNISDIPVPRFSVVTAGNMGRSLSGAFERFGLPPIKIVVDPAIPEDRLSRLRKLHADIYKADLRRELRPEDIQRITNNIGGVEITSVAVIEPQSTFYDWHVHEAFNEQPGEIYVPYGSGRLMENYLTWQQRTLRNAVQGKQDPRLRAPATKVISINILAAEPQRIRTSVADKLTKFCNPYVLFEDQDMIALKALGATGPNTGIHRVSEAKIKEAYKILNQHMPTEPSGAAGLALYMQRHEQGLVELGKKVLIVNTGKGI